MTLYTDFDICIIGSGAGAGPIAFEAAKNGQKVLILEKGPWLKESDFYKDEVTYSRRRGLRPHNEDEPHGVETTRSDGSIFHRSTAESGWDFHNGSLVGGASNLMSGYFQRMKDKDFRLLSEFGAVKNANIVDWPITYDDLEPYYDKVEKVVGVSGKVCHHPLQERRSSPDFPFPPTLEHTFATNIDEAGKELGLNVFTNGRAILSRPHNNRSSCQYSGYCGTYGCSSGAKGSSRAALLDQALETGNCFIWPEHKVRRIQTDQKGKATRADFIKNNGETGSVSAKIFVVACQAIESSRLLLSSIGAKHPKGIGNSHDQVGKNLLFSASASGGGTLKSQDYTPKEWKSILLKGPFLNRSFQDYYYLSPKDDPQIHSPIKGGGVDLLFAHPNPIVQAYGALHQNGNHLWGDKLVKSLKKSFKKERELIYEVFLDWLPHDQSRVSLDSKYKDIWGDPAAKVMPEIHPHNRFVAEILSRKTIPLFQKLGCQNIHTRSTGGPATNLQAGGCRFGTDIRHSVLDTDCRIHDCQNVFVSDGSFMPTGGSVPYTFTIYANSFRVADKIMRQI